MHTFACLCIYTTRHDTKYTYEFWVKQNQKIAQCCMARMERGASYHSTNFPKVSRVQRRLMNFHVYFFFIASAYCCCFRLPLFLHPHIFSYSFASRAPLSLSQCMKWNEKLMKIHTLKLFLQSLHIHHLKWRAHSQVHCLFWNKYTSSERMK